MKFIKIISQSNMKNVEILLKGALNRIPILIISEDEENIEEIINGLSNLLSFRNSLIFYNDFISNEDYKLILNNEESDYWIQRNLFISFPYSFEKLISNIRSFQSWIIGCNPNELSDKRVLLSFISKMSNEKQQFLIVKIKDERLSIEITGVPIQFENLNFEKWIFHNAILRTERTIEKMKRIISKGISNPNFDAEEYRELMNFSLENEELKENMIKKEITNFYEASRRVFNILNRIKILESLNIQISLSKRTLNSIVAFKFASIARILEFIKAEWDLDFKEIFDAKKQTNFTDTFESLWG